MHPHPQSPHSAAHRAHPRCGINSVQPYLIRVLAVAGLLVALSGCVVSDGPGPVVYEAPPPSGGDEVVYRAPDGPADDVVITSDSDFYGPLEPYGEWVEVDGYGRCWQPRNVDRDWRPYTNGQWRRTDSGWYWESDESWGWATSHYGRWNQDSRHGWYWVPDTQWAPAWVSWREGGGYTGWAPLPPRRRSGVTVEVDVAPQAFVYVEERHFSERVRPTTVIVNNTTIINKTVNINQTRITNNTVINGGPRTEVIERATGRKVNVTPVHEVRQIDEKKGAVKSTPRQNPAVRQDKTSPPATPNRDPRETRQPQTPPPQTPAVQHPNQPPPPQAGSPAGRQVVPPPQPVAPGPEHRERERERDKPAPLPAVNEKRETPVQPITGPRGSQAPNAGQPKNENGGPAPAAVQKETAPKPTPPPPKPVKDLKKKPPVEKAPPPPKDKPDEPKEKDKQQPQ